MNHFNSTSQPPASQFCEGFKRLPSSFQIFSKWQKVFRNLKVIIGKPHNTFWCICLNQWRNLSKLYVKTIISVNIFYVFYYSFVNCTKNWIFKIAIKVLFSRVWKDSWYNKNKFEKALLSIRNPLFFPICAIVLAKCFTFWLH